MSELNRLRERHADLQQECKEAYEMLDEARRALRRIASQAVCVNMDGDAGNEKFLRHILEIADEIVAETANAMAPKSVPSVEQTQARGASSKKPSPPQTC